VAMRARALEGMPNTSAVDGLAFTAGTKANPP